MSRSFSLASVDGGIMSQILIVDDDVLFLQAICADTDFESIGFSQVHTASSAQEARSILAHMPIRVLLCDIEMPGESGLDLLRWVQERQLSVVTILLTCYSSFDYAQRAIRLGVFDYVLKPVRSDLLHIRLKQALAQATGSVENSTETAPENDLIEQIQKYVEQNIHTELTREQIGRDFFMNPDYIARLFRQRTEQSLNDYIRFRRIERAQKLLRETNLPVSLICTKVGYSYNTYFFHTFKQVVGVSPSEYRKALNDS